MTTPDTETPAVEAERLAAKLEGLLPLVHLADVAEAVRLLRALALPQPLAQEGEAVGETAEAIRMIDEVRGLLEAGKLAWGDLMLSRALDVLRRVRPQEGEARALPDVDTLAQIIRRVDGSNSLGAGALAEAILAALPAPTDEAGRVREAALQEALTEAENALTAWSHVNEGEDYEAGSFVVEALAALLPPIPDEETT